MHTVANALYKQHGSLSIDIIACKNKKIQNVCVLQTCAQYNKHNDRMTDACCEATLTHTLHYISSGCDEMHSPILTNKIHTPYVLIFCVCLLCFHPFAGNYEKKNNTQEKKTSNISFYCSCRVQSQ